MLRQLVLAAAVASAPVSGTQDRTITRVVKLLESMLVQSKSDGKKDVEVFGKFQCYCDKNEAAKEALIEEKTNEVSMLQAKIESLVASSQKLSQEVNQLQRDIDANLSAREEGIAVRGNENTAFVETEADLAAALVQMRSAIETLSAVGGDQTASTGAADHKQLMKLLATSRALARRLSGAQRAKVQALLQAPFTGQYTSQSVEVVGILRSMRDTFSDNLKEVRSMEAAAAKAHSQFLLTNQKEFNTMDSLFNAKQGKLASNDSQLATHRGSLATSQPMLADAQTFLASLVSSCDDKRKEYDQRKLFRANEEVAITQAVSILNSDEAFETMGNVSATVSGSTSLFVQIRGHSQRARLVATLEKAAAQTKSVRLSQVAAAVSANNPFVTVLSSINKTLKSIEAERNADEEKFNWCSDEQSTHNGIVDEKLIEEGTHTATIDATKEAIDHPETGLLMQISIAEGVLEMNAESQKITHEDRAAEHQAYMVQASHLSKTHVLLKKAVTVLKKYYAKLDRATRPVTPALVEKGPTTEPALPETWDDEDAGYDGQKVDGSSAVSMLQFILSETTKERDQFHTEEANAQHAYEVAMHDLKAEESSTRGDLERLDGELASKRTELAQAVGDRDAAVKSRKASQAYLDQIEPGCTFIQDHIDSRILNREAEKRALNQVITFLEATPVFQAAEADAEVAALGKCRDLCIPDREVVDCKACIAEVSIEGYCAGHPGTQGC